ncbi:hypothetical protein [Amycolatopsis sp. DG1A-15b]|uniref:hypothetical protein n=1 Tax=Amycolatopsis sp. DG1A-15b TaxID=3052846 RepID=UPI00255B81C5|nr:hypothetical protein [Amycolatopsis sp. DG1A-15b]WIX91389.1 hypothetical protein QRY02_13435 [Amycolatopsis sp. DG1A-15b]
MAFSLDHVVLAHLDVPDVATINAQLNELLQPGGQRVEPAAEYEARDSSGTIRVAVDAQRRLTDVGIRPGWASKIPAAQLAGVLFQTYVAAIQRAMVVELANSTTGATTAEPATADRADNLPALDESQPYDEWITAIRARMNDLHSQLDRIHRLDASRMTPPASDVRSPRGFFVLHLRGGSPAGVTGSVNVLSNAGADRLQLDFLEMFAAAGLAAPVTPAASHSGRRPPRDDDDDVFEFRYDD